MTTTDIEWADEVWNPLVGCSRVSPGCDNCYAINVAHRSSGPVPLQQAHAGLTIKQPGERADWTGEVRTLAERLTLPKWRTPKRVFVNSMSDLFHHAVKREFIAEVFATMALAPEHTFIVLTKRPQRMAELLDDERLWYLIQDAQNDRGYGDPTGAWPLPNVHLGASIEQGRYAWRANHVRNSNAAVRILSVEPMLDDVGTSLNLDGIDWVVAGGESGRGARPIHPNWVRDLRDRCVAADVPFFFKQWGEWQPIEPVYSDDHTDVLIDGYDDRRIVSFNLAGSIEMDLPRNADPAGQQPHPIGAPWWLAQVGKHNAGRILDGRTWDELPKAVTHAA